MKGKRLFALLLTAALIIAGAAVYAGGGTADDPLVTLSYLRDIFTRPVEQKLAEGGDQLLQSSLTKLDPQTYSAALGTKLDSALTAALETRVNQRVAEKLAALKSQVLLVNMKQLSLSKGDRIVGAPGAGVVLTSGAGTICGGSGSSVLNITAGSLRTPGSAIASGVYYMVLADDGSGVAITSDTATVLVRDSYRVVSAYTAQYTDYADALRTLGLFYGSNKGYELERAPTRQEALIMLIRLLGEEKDALAYTETGTFGDVTGWADGQKYIHYGEHMGYTNGNGVMSDGRTKFSQYDSASLDMYLTFVLRSLGYNDKAGDFIWNSTSRTLAVQIGLLTENDVQSIQKAGLMRDHVTYISYHALWTKLKNSTSTLGDKLVTNGTITRSALDAAKGLK